MDNFTDLSGLPMTAPQEYNLRRHVYDGDAKSAPGRDIASPGFRTALNRAYEIAKELKGDLPRGDNPDEVVAVKRFELKWLRSFPKLILATVLDANRSRKELEARVAAIESRETKSLADAYRGAWLPGAYTRGQLTTHAGSLWLCVESAAGKPGESHCWRLIVKGAR